MIHPRPRPNSSRMIVRRYVWVSLMAGLGGVGIGGCAAEEVTKAGLASGCSINSDCTSPLVCSFEKCHAACRASSDCSMGARCVIVSAGAGVCQLEQDTTTCTYDTDCAKPLACAVDGQCRNECKSVRDCAGGQVCTPSGSCADRGEVNAMGELQSVADGGGVVGAGGNGQGGDTTTKGGAGGFGGAPVFGRDASPPLGGFGGGSNGGLPPFGGGGPGGTDPKGSGGFPPGCGTVGTPCCPPSQTCIDPSTICAQFGCVSCGGINQPCCTNDACSTGGTCDNGTCVACGAVGQPCCGNQCSGALSCISGACDVACTSPLVAKQGACILPAPRPIAPISGSNVGTRSPKLWWELPAGIAAAHVQVCKDRPCSNVLFETDAATSTTVGTALPPGTAFWRLSSVWAGDAGAASLAYGPVWEMLIGGAHDAPTSTVWGTVPDFNGDGYADAIAQANTSTGADIRVYAGSGQGLSSTPTTVSTAAGGPKLNLPVGDFDGDGYTDLVLQGGPGYEVHRGSASGSLATVSQQLNTPLGGESAQLAADFDGDGYADLLVLSTVRDVDGNSFLSFNTLAGGPNGLANTPSTVITSVLYDSGFGTADAADIDGDGHTDVVVADTSGGSFNGTLSIFSGGPSGLSSSPQTVNVTSSGGPMLTVSTAGDVNDDGYDDVVVQTGNSVLQYLGSSSGLATASSATLSGNVSGGAGPRTYVVLGLGDSDGDGYDDIVVADNQQSVRVYFGSSGGLSSNKSQLLTPPPPPNFTVSTAMLMALSGLGDVDGDGFGDIGLGVEWTSTAQIRSNRTYAFHGGSPFPTTPVTTISVGIMGLR